MFPKSFGKFCHNNSVFHAQANKLPRINQKLPKESYATHLNKIKENRIGFNLIAETSSFDLDFNYHNHSSPIYDCSLLNQQTEFNNKIKKHHQNET